MKKWFVIYLLNDFRKVTRRGNETSGATVSVTSGAASELYDKL